MFEYKMQSIVSVPHFLKNGEADKQVPEGIPVFRHHVPSPMRPDWSRSGPEHGSPSWSTVI